MNFNIIALSRNQLLLFVSLFLFSNCLLAQSVYSRLNIASPNASSLGKFVDVPVNNHTGIPQVDIPIYTVQEGPLQLPISVSYHAGGVKVAEPASWVGAGWTLNAGGVITRTVRGIPDEAANTVGGQKGHFSNYGYSSYLADPTRPDYLNANDLSTLKADGEPDLFFFNFNGHSGKFYFDDDRTPVLVSGTEDLKINYYFRLPVSNSTFLNTNIQGFCITTGDGIRYFFGKTKAEEISQGVYPVEVTIPFTYGGGLSGDRVVSSWYLNRIESADKSSAIDFIYEAESYSNYSWSYFPVPLTNATTEESKGYQMFKLLISGVRLSKINFSNGSIDFTTSNTPRLDLAGGSIPNAVFIETANTEAKALKEIVVSNKKYNTRKFSFYSSYFEDNTSSLPTGAGSIGNAVSDTKRLKLDSLVESGKDGKVLKPYTFNYYSNFLPRRLSFAQDHWGFYNGASNSEIMPAFTIDKYDEHTGANRDAAWPQMLNGALTKITYPTGGYTNFEFEANKARIDATGYKLVLDKQCWVGFDGSGSKEWTALSFTGNEKYQLSFSNTDCGTSSITSCTASFSIINPDGSVLSTGSASAGAVQTYALTIPPGIYKVRMYRDGVYSGKGATLTFSKYTTYSIVDPIVGGLRIKTITKNALDSSSPALIENYSYEENGRSTGVLFERPYYVYMLRSDLAAKIGILINDIGDYGFYPNGCVPSSLWNSTYFENKIKSPASILPMSATMGNHIGYKSVKIDKGLNGYSVFRYLGSNLYENVVDDVAYRNLNTICDLKTPSFPAIPVQFEFNRGELSSEDHFDSNGSLRKEVFYTSTFDSTKVYTPALKVGNMNGFTSQAEYQLRGYWKINTTRYETLIDNQTLQQQHIIDTTFCESRFHRLPTKKTARLSNGNLSTTKLKYILDFKLPATELIDDGWATFNSGCATCLTEYNNKLANTAASLADRAAYYFAYKACISRARKKYTDYHRANFTDPDNNYSTTHLGFKNNADTEFKSVLEMQDQFINSPVETTEWVNNKLVKSIYSSYSFEPGTANVYLSELKNINISAPILSGFTNSVNTNSSIIKDARYETQYLYRNLKGVLVEQNKLSAPKEVFLWGYNNKYPVARILAGDYNSLISSVDQNVLNNINTSDVQMRTELDKLRSGFPNALISTYTYEPLAGITSQTDPKGVTTYYQYDEFQRLSNLLDQNRNIVKNFNYNYSSKTDLYRNTTMSQVFTKVCGSGTGSTYTYTVAAGVYTSNISQADANAKAQADINVNGQNAANANGTCTYSNTAVSQLFTKNNCSGIATGSNYTYAVPAARYFSTISQADADAKAQADVNANGQNAANVNGICTYYNVALTQTFTKACSSGGVGSTYPYSVAQGKYSSNSSQEDANAKAQAEINSNGQAAANANGSCTFYNVSASQDFVRNNCTGSTVGSNYTYTIPAGKYSSAVSQADANAQASADLAANGQNMANVNGTCIEKPLITLTVTNGSTNIIYFNVIINGINVSGPRSVGAKSNTNVVTNVLPNANSTVIVSITSGFVPWTASLSGFWGSISGIISGTQITFKGANFSVTQGVNMTLN